MECFPKDSIYFYSQKLGRLHFLRTHSFLEKTGVYPGTSIASSLYKRMDKVKRI